MEVKNEPVDREYNEEGHPPYDAWSDLPTVKTEALETFEITAHQNSASSTRPLINYSPKTSPVSFVDIEIDEINLKNEVIERQRPVVIVINLEKKSFHERNFVCSICLQLFTSFDSLSLHKNVHHESILSMNYTNDAASRVACLQLDSRKRGANPNNGATPLQFENFSQCDFESAYRTFLEKPDQKQFENIKSDSQTFYIHNLGQTVKTTSDGDQYRSIPYLNIHKQSYAPEKLFKCNQCHYKSAWKSHLNIHIRSHTGEKPFECDQCNYKSARKTGLIDHKLTHTGQKPFGCDQCDYKSAQSSNLKTHKRLHTGEEKTFECDQCGCKFKRKTHLTVHKLSHSGKKPFECDQCKYKSVWKSQMNAHQFLHKNK